MEVEKEVREEGGKVMIEKEKVGDERKMEDIIEMREIIQKKEKEEDEIKGIEKKEIDQEEEEGRKIMERGKKIVIIKIGRSGEMMVKEDEVKKLKKLKVKVVDKVEEGESLKGGFEVDLQKERKLND